MKNKRRGTISKQLKLARNDVVITNIDFLNILSKYFDYMHEQIEEFEKEKSPDTEEAFREIVKIQSRKLSHFSMVLANANKKISAIGNAKITTQQAKLLIEAIDEDFNNLDIIGK